MAKQYSLYQYVVWSLHGLSAYVILTDSSSGPSHTAGVRGDGICEDIFYYILFLDSRVVINNSLRWF